MLGSSAETQSSNAGKESLNSPEEATPPLGTPNEVLSCSAELGIYRASSCAAGPTSPIHFARSSLHTHATHPAAHPGTYTHVHTYTMQIDHNSFGSNGARRIPPRLLSCDSAAVRPCHATLSLFAVGILICTNNTNNLHTNVHYAESQHATSTSHHHKVSAGTAAHIDAGVLYVHQQSSNRQLN